MHKQHLASALEAMRRELDGLDGARRERLEAIIAELESAAETEDGGDGSLVERARQRIEQFEVEHPTATGVTNRVLQALADLGI